MINGLKYRYVLMHIPLEDEGMIYNHTLIYIVIHVIVTRWFERGGRETRSSHTRTTIVSIGSYTYCVL